MTMFPQTLGIWRLNQTSKYKMRLHKICSILLEKRNGSGCRNLGRWCWVCSARRENENLECTSFSKGLVTDHFWKVFPHIRKLRLYFVLPESDLKNFNERLVHNECSSVTYSFFHLVSKNFQVRLNLLLRAMEIWWNCKTKFSNIPKKICSISEYESSEVARSISYSKTP